MRVHSVKHGRYDACRVSVSALFVMTSFFLLRFSPLCSVRAISVSAFPFFRSLSRMVCGCSIIFRLCLTNLALIVYPYYTLAIPLHLRSDYFFVAFDKFIVADESIDGYNESADKVKN